MHDYVPRLLLPGAAGLPAHIAVGNAVSVFNRLSDPTISAAVWTPHWSPLALSAFNIAARQGGKHDVQDKLALAAADKLQEHDFIAVNTHKWLEPAFAGQSAEDAQHIMDEVVGRQQDFLKALRMHRFGHARNLDISLSRGSPDDNAGNELVFAPPPARSRVFVVEDDGGVFASPVGAVLVNQDNLYAELPDLDMLRDPSLPVHKLANRLWQVPDNSFMALRGQLSSYPQLRAIPPVPPDTFRYRLLVQP